MGESHEGIPLGNPMGESHRGIPLGIPCDVTRWRSAPTSNTAHFVRAWFGLLRKQAGCRTGTLSVHVGSPEDVTQRALSVLQASRSAAVAAEAGVERKTPRTAHRCRRDAWRSARPSRYSRARSMRARRCRDPSGKSPTASSQCVLPATIFNLLYIYQQSFKRN